MIQPIQPPTGPAESSAGRPKSKLHSEPIPEHDGEFERAMESIAVQLAKDFWSEQDIKK